MGTPNALDATALWTGMKNSARTPTSQAAQRIAAIFHRQLSTKWSEKEIKVFRQLVKDGCFDVLDGLGQIERCYKMQWPPRREKNILRHDLMTFLNNYQTEVDRATAWCESHPLKPKPRVIIPYTPPSDPAPPLSPEDEATQGKFMEQYREHKRISAFSRVKRDMGK